MTPPLKTCILLAGKACLSFQSVIKRLGLTVVGHGRVANTVYSPCSTCLPYFDFLATMLGEGQSVSWWKPGTHSLLAQRQLILVDGR